MTTTRPVVPDIELTTGTFYDRQQLVASHEHNWGGHHNCAVDDGSIRVVHASFVSLTHHEDGFHDAWNGLRIYLEGQDQLDYTKKSAYIEGTPIKAGSFQLSLLVECAQQPVPANMIGHTLTNLVVTGETFGFNEDFAFAHTHTWKLTELDKAVLDKKEWILGGAFDPGSDDQVNSMKALSARHQEQLRNISNGDPVSLDFIKGLGVANGPLWTKGNDNPLDTTDNVYTVTNYLAPFYLKVTNKGLTVTGSISMDPFDDPIWQISYNKTNGLVLISPKVEVQAGTYNIELTARNANGPRSLGIRIIKK